MQRLTNRDLFKPPLTLRAASLRCKTLITFYHGAIELKPEQQESTLFSQCFPALKKSFPQQS